MLKINPEDARREILKRVTRTQRSDGAESYNTGSTVSIDDAQDYIGYLMHTGTTYRHNSIYPTRFNVFHGTGAGVAFISEVRGESAAPLYLFNPGAMVGIVRTTFNLTVSQTAQVFHVSRPTIYQWESIEDYEKIRAKRDRDRLLLIYNLADKWQSWGPLTGRWVNAEFVQGKSVFDLLCAEKPDMMALRDAHEKLMEVTAQLRQSESSRSIEAAEALTMPFAQLAEAQKKRDDR